MYTTISQSKQLDYLRNKRAVWSRWMRKTDCRADLWGADLWGANLTDANLTDANLGDAELGDADLGDANLTGANLGGANLRGANLGGATGICALYVPGMSSRGDWLYAVSGHDETGGVMLKAGCFWGTITEFRAQLHQQRDGTKHETLYNAALTLIEAWYVVEMEEAHDDNS